MVWKIGMIFKITRPVMVGIKNNQPHRNSLLARLDPFNLMFMQPLRFCLKRGGTLHCLPAFAYSSARMAFIS